jgi:phosphate starvation-inducible PhoH-like protein
MFFSSFRTQQTTPITLHKNTKNKISLNIQKNIICSKKQQYPPSKPNIEPTPKQIVYQEFMREFRVPLVIGVGPAGTGKTHFACKIALEHLENHKINKIIITRPTISVGQNIGFLPGDIEAKMTPWLIPLYDNFVKTSDDMKLIKTYFHNHVIEICPLSYIRGRTFDNCFVIADEMQNSSISEMKSLVTRIGDNSKLVITGDINQTDLSNNTNGLEHFMSMLQEKKDVDTTKIQYVIFDNSDIKRSEFVKYVLELYDADHSISN